MPKTRGSPSKRRGIGCEPCVTTRTATSRRVDMDFEEHVLEPSAVWVERSRRDLVPIFAVFVLEADTVGVPTVVVLPCPCVSRSKATDHTRQTRGSSAGTNGPCERVPRWCHHRRSELLLLRRLRHPKKSGTLLTKNPKTNRLGVRTLGCPW
jgi:hypothetical protein